MDLGFLHHLRKCRRKNWPVLVLSSENMSFFRRFQDTSYKERKGTVLWWTLVSVVFFLILTGYSGFEKATRIRFRFLKLP